MSVQEPLPALRLLATAMADAQVADPECWRALMVSAHGIGPPRGEGELDMDQSIYAHVVEGMKSALRRQPELLGDA